MISAKGGTMKFQINEIAMDRGIKSDLQKVKEIEIDHQLKAIFFQGDQGGIKQYLETGEYRAYGSVAESVFNTHPDILDEEYIAFTEGVWDKLSIDESGIKAVALYSSTFNPKNKKFYENLNPGKHIILLMLDADKAGYWGTQRNGTHLQKRGFEVYVVKPKAGYKDFNEELLGEGKLCKEDLLSRKLRFTPHVPKVKTIKKKRIKGGQRSDSANLKSRLLPSDILGYFDCIEWDEATSTSADQYLMCSPFRDDNSPSFSVKDTFGDGICHDFGTGEYWDIFGLIEGFSGEKDFKKVIGIARNILKEWYGEK